MSSEIFEHRRTVIREARELLANASRNDRLRGFQRGDFDSEEEALEGIELGPFEVSDEDVLHSFALDLDAVSSLRSTSQRLGSKWTEVVRKRWRDQADEIERQARAGLGLKEAA